MLNSAVGDLLLEKGRNDERRGWGFESRDDSSSDGGDSGRKTGLKTEKKGED